MTDRMIDGVPAAAGADALAFAQAGMFDMPSTLELKADEPGSLAAMADMLGRMRGELDQQFRTFADLRDGAVRRTGDDQPEGEAKQARADLKAAVDALSVIVRTLEKVDQLERQLARDRAELEAQPESQDSYDALWSEVSGLIEARVEERLAERVQQRLHELGIEPPRHAGAPPGEAMSRGLNLSVTDGADAAG